MRFNNAPCNPQAGIRLRRPSLGACYRLIGYLIVGIAAIGGPDRVVSGICFAAAAAAWFACWWQQVGNLHRTSLGCAMLVTAAQLGLLQHTGALW